MTNKENSTRRTLLLDLQTQMLNQAQASRQKLTPGQEQKFAEYTNEINMLLSQPTSSPFIPGMGASQKPTMSSDYKSAFWEAIKDRNLNFSNSALSEGGSAADGSFIVPISVDPGITPLAQVECSARRLSTVIVTEHDMYLPSQTVKSVAETKLETTDLGTHAFASNVPSFGSVLLQSHMIGDSVPISLELFQDTKVGDFCAGDLTRAVVAKEEDAFVNGVGGPTAPTGYLTAATSSGSSALSIDALLDFSSTLRQAYYAGAKWCANRQTIVQLVKAQLAANQYQRFVEYDAKGGCSILGWPCEFSSAMPVYAASPLVDGAILFGDFATGYTLGDRGTSDIRVKMLDQVAALNGQVVLLAYRRSSQVCRIAEAVRVLTITG
jgi:HK97 family phage major capsid protein